EPVEAGQRQWPGPVQLAGKRPELGIALVQGGETFLRERVLLNGYEIEPPRTRGRSPPCIPGREEVEAQAEAQLQDREAALTRPARGQAVATEKHVAGLARSGIGAVIDVAVFGRVG